MAQNEVPRVKAGPQAGKPLIIPVTGGKPTNVPGPTFWAKVDFFGAEGCWQWLASTDSQGYGQVNLGGRNTRAHRATYLSLVGEVPGHLVLDHLCHNRACVNPDHLEAVTQSENVRRGDGAAFWRDKTHCPRKHPYAGDNLYTSPTGARVCRACKAIRAASARDRAKAAA